MASQPQSPKPPSPGVSIVVPVYQGEAGIGACLESLLKQDYPRDLLQIIVVNNGSTDRTAAIVRSFPVTLIDEPRRGVACARNCGWRHAQHGLVAFTDCDCVAAPTWITNLVKGFNTNTRLAVCGGSLQPAIPQSLIERYIIYKGILSQEMAWGATPISPSFLVTANAMFRRSVLEEMGGFDEGFVEAGEDADLCWRIAWRGYELAFEPSAIVYHRHRSTLGGMLRQVRNYGAGESRLFAKHRQKLGFRTWQNTTPYYELIRSFFAIPFALLFRKNKLEKLIPLLEFLGAIWYLYGKLSTSFKLRVRYL